MSKQTARWWLVVLVLVNVGCVHQPSPELLPAGQSDQSRQSLSWFAECFQMTFESISEVNWTTDLILADQVIAPALSDHRSKIPLWRFHRRAANDQTGHQFSFIYYTDDSTQQKIADQITHSQLLQSMLKEGQVNRRISRCRNGGLENASLAATSDPNWDIRIQRSWPYFIMGVSAHWLALIREIREPMPPNEDLYELYGDVEAELIKLWQAQGQHAYFHHISAVFGYQPMFFQKWIQF